MRRWCCYFVVGFVVVFVCLAFVLCITLGCFIFCRRPLEWKRLRRYWCVAVPILFFSNCFRASFFFLWCPSVVFVVFCCVLYFRVVYLCVLLCLFRCVCFELWCFRVFVFCFVSVACVNLVVVLLLMWVWVFSVFFCSCFISLLRFIVVEICLFVFCLLRVCCAPVAVALAVCSTLSCLSLSRY